MKRKASVAGLRARLTRAAKRVKLKKTLKSYVKKAVINTLEKKYFNGKDFTNLYFDRVASISNYLFQITPGTGEGNRIGSEIFVKGISLKMYAQFTGTKDVTLHYAYVRSDQESTGASLDFALNLNKYFIDTSANSNANNWRIDPEKVTLIKRGSIKIKSDSISKTNYATRQLYLKVNKKVIWNQNGTGFFKNQQYYMLVWAHIPGAGLTPIEVWYDYRVMFRDV